MKISIYDYTDYKPFIRDFISNKPNFGRGEIQKIAQTLGMHPSLVSQILRRERNFSMEQAMGMAQYLELDDMAQEYFLRLVELAKAGTFQLKTFITQKINELKKNSMELSKRISHNKTLSPEDKKTYYSHWSYMALWAAFSLKHIETVEDAAQMLSLPIDEVKKAVDFLLSRGMLIIKEGRVQHSVRITHLADDPLILSKHHSNWRMKAMEFHPIMSKENLSYTAPMTISKKDFLKVREQIVVFIKSIIKTVDVTDPENVVFLNIDWINFKS